MISNTSVLNTTGVKAPLLNQITNKYLIALIILLVGITIGKLVSRLVEFLLRKIGLNKTINKLTGHELLLEEMISTFIEYTFYFIALVLALQKLNIINNILLWLSIGVVLILLIALFLSLRDAVVNFTSGAIIRSKKILKKKEHVIIDDVEGIVLKVDLLDTLLKNIKEDQGEIIRIPNSRVLKARIKKIIKSEKGVNESKTKKNKK